MLVPSIVVQESDMSSLSVPRATLPSLDLTNMRNREMGGGYSPTSPAFGARLQPNPRGHYRSESEDEANSQNRSWSSLGAPGSQVSNPTNTEESSEMYALALPFVRFGLMW